MALSLAALAVGALALWFRADLYSLLSKKQNIVVILVDTLRPDHRGVYGYAKDTSPEIDELAKRGTVYTSAYSVSNWTNPTIKPLFTGLSPQAVMREAWHADAIKMPLPQEVMTFAEWIKKHGYRTAALVDHPGIKARYHFDQGFDAYQMLYEEDASGRGTWGKSDINVVAEQFAGKLDDYLHDPFLIYLHVVYPHRPYGAPGAYQGMFGPDTYRHFAISERAAMINAYDAEIKRTDDLIGKLSQSLSSRGLLENTWIILLSDHGEGFWEHGFAEHGHVFFDEIIRVPLIVVPPNGAQLQPGQVDDPVSNVDVFATILDIAGAPLPEGTIGLSLAGRGSSVAVDPRRIVFSESAHSWDIQARTVIRDGLKYSNYPNRPEAQRNFLFNLREDPLERRNLYGKNPQIEAELREILDKHHEQAEIEREWLTQSILEPDEETLNGPRSLGYIQ